MREKRIVYACDTPLQILNAINLHENSFSTYRGDMFIYDQFGKAKEIADKLRNVDIFDNVYLIKRYKEYSGVLQKIATIKRMLFPYLTIKKYLSGKNEIKKRKYNYAVLSFITTFSITVFGISKKRVFIQLEDGIGTYIGNILNDYTTGLFKKVISITSYNTILRPEKVCVYNPQVYKGNIPVLCLKNCLSKEVSEKVEYVFEYNQNQIYKDSKMIYLSQPLYDVKGFNEKKQCEINLVLEKYRQEILVRMHPREQKNMFVHYNIDTVKNLWELECIHQIDDDNILISGFSTAQLMPKILMNKEPYVVFLYKLVIEDVNNEYWKEIKNFIDEFKGFYSNPDKIYIPETVSEFEKTISAIMRSGEIYE